MSEDNMTDQSVDQAIDALAKEAGENPLSQSEQKEEVQAEAASTNEWKEILGALLTPTFALVVPAWNLQEEEIDALTDAYSHVLNKYSPGSVSAFGAEISAALVTLAIFAPRIKLPRKKEPIEGEIVPDQEETHANT